MLASVDVVVRLHETVARACAAQKLKVHVPEAIIADFGLSGDHYLYLVLTGVCYERLGGKLVECARGGYDETNKIIPRNLPGGLSIYIKEIDATATSWVDPERRIDISKMQLG